MANLQSTLVHRPNIAGFLLMVGVGIFAFGATRNPITIWLIPFLILGPMLFAALGMLVGTVTKNPETAGVIGNIVTFPMMFLAGTFFPISSMPEYLQTFAHVLPLFYVTRRPKQRNGLQQHPSCTHRHCCA